MSMRELSSAILFCCVAMTAAAQAQKPVPIEELRGKNDALIQGQQRAEFAYRKLQDAEYKRKLAEQDYVNTRDAYRAAQQHTDDLRRQVDATKRRWMRREARKRQLARLTKRN